MPGKEKSIPYSQIFYDHPVTGSDGLAFAF